MGSLAHNKWNLLKLHFPLFQSPMECEVLDVLKCNSVTQLTELQTFCFFLLSDGSPSDSGTLFESQSRVPDVYISERFLPTFSPIFLQI